MKFRFWRIIEKNFKLLFRSRASAFILFIGPILIIALVGFFFSGKAGNELSIGYHSPDETPLTKEFVSALQKSEFVVLNFSSEDDCVAKIKQGVIHTCIIFPPNFQIQNSKASDLRFIVDYSRINLVYKVIDAVSDIIDFETRSVSKGLTSVLLDNINETIADMNSFEGIEAGLSSQDKQVKSNVDAALLSLSGMDFESSSLTSDRIRSDAVRLNATIDDFKNQSYELLGFTENVLAQLDDADYLDSNESERLHANLEDINSSLEDIDNLSALQASYLYASIDNLNRSLSGLVEQNQKNAQLSDKIKQELSQAGARLDTLKKGIDGLAASTQGTRKRLEGISITRADVIANPINTQIEPVVAESSNLQSTFPFLVVLIIMFASLMIASTLVIFEKTSKALFRNFMAPVSEKMFILASFATVLLIILIQAIVILLISQVALSLELFSSIFLVLFIVLIAAVFFSVLGMLIGHLFSSQEGSVMASLVVGSVFLFLSNLVVPLESISPTLSQIVRYNPFIIFSDLLRKALLFRAPVSEAIGPLAILFSISLAVLLGLLFAKGLFFRRKVRMPPRRAVP